MVEINKGDRFRLCFFPSPSPDSFSFSFSSSSSSSSHATQYYYHTVRNSSKGKRSTGCRVLLLLLLQLESSHKQIIIVHRYSRLAYLLAAFDVFISFHFISFHFVSFRFVLFRSQSTMICHRCFFQCDGNSNKQGKNMYFVQLHKDEKERSEWLIFCATELLAIYVSLSSSILYISPPIPKQKQPPIRFESNRSRRGSKYPKPIQHNLSLSLSLSLRYAVTLIVSRSYCMLQYYRLYDCHPSSFLLYCWHFT